MKRRTFLKHSGTAIVAAAIPVTVANAAVESGSTPAAKIVALGAEGLPIDAGGVGFYGAIPIPAMSLIGIEDAAGNFGATTIEGALIRLRALVSQV